MKRQILFVIICLISFVSIVLITGSPFKSYTNSLDHNNPIHLKIPSIHAQDDGEDFENDDGGNDGNDDFAGFEEEDDVNNQKENEDDTNQFSFESEEPEDNDAEETEDHDADQFSFETENEDQESDQEDIEDQQTEVGNTPFTFVAEKPDQDTQDAEETEDVAVQEEDQGGNDDATPDNEGVAVQEEDQGEVIMYPRSIVSINFIS
ncbi:MAG TPA: hypothetical protein VFP49_04505 [Nitrososphaeraceae archaeon]|nr:hypothetical protein [Nitrososphaeraceae archaeon]